MNKIILVASFLSLQANASVNSLAVLSNPAVTAISKLMNDKYVGQCQLPTKEDDVIWRCMGALPPVTEPTIVPTGCHFKVSITCPGESAMISGIQKSWIVVSPTPNTIKPVDGGIDIWDIKFVVK